MKTVINIVLAVCAAALVYVCYGSIMGPINFDQHPRIRQLHPLAQQPEYALQAIRPSGKVRLQHRFGKQPARWILTNIRLPAGRGAQPHLPDAVECHRADSI